jgi:quercetin dioxygenase-like cupin family protein
MAYSQGANTASVKVLGFDLFEQGSKTILGQEYLLPNKDPYLVMRNVEMPIGFTTDIHQHSQPVYLLIFDGALEIDYGSKGKKSFHSGQAYVEAINWCHQGRSIGDTPLKMLAIYISDKNYPEQIKPSACGFLN